MMISGDSLRGIRNAQESLGIHSRNIANLATKDYQSLDVVVSNGSPRARLQSSTPGGFSQGVASRVNPLVPAPAQETARTSGQLAETSSTRFSPDSSGERSNTSNDLATNLLGLKEDRREVGYNLSAIKVQDRMMGSLMDLVG